MPLESRWCAPARVAPSIPVAVTSPAAFTLVEVVVALGIFSFAVVAIAGLFFVGLNSNKESSDEIQAADLASLLISTRRALPAATGTALANFALPALTSNTSGIVGVEMDGTKTTGTEVPAYNLDFQVTTSSGPGAHLAQVYLLLWWPAAAVTGTNDPSKRYELATQVGLP